MLWQPSHSATPPLWNAYAMPPNPMMIEAAATMAKTHFHSLHGNPPLVFSGNPAIP